MATVPCGSIIPYSGVPIQSSGRYCVANCNLSSSTHCCSSKRRLGSSCSTIFSPNFLCTYLSSTQRKDSCQYKRSLLIVRAARNYYSLLGVAEDAKKSDIKSAYRKLARSYHPDVNKDPGAEQKFKELSNAYEVLSDDEKRSMYDRYGEAGPEGGASDFGSPFDVFDQFRDFGGTGMGMGANFRDGSMDGEHVAYILRVDFKEAVFGAEKNVEITRLEHCATCEGSGAKPGTRSYICRTCNGQGQLISSSRIPFGYIQHATCCPDCDGMGKRFSPCSRCRGEGRVKKSKRIDIKVPAGIETGDQLKVRSEGNSGKRGGGPGDLLVGIEVREDPVFKRDGNNILYTCRISYIDAILGAVLEVPTVNGMAELKIPPGTQPNATLVMRKKGVPLINKKNRRGDQLVKVKVEIPKTLRSEERKLVEELAILNKVSVPSSN